MGHAHASLCLVIFFFHNLSRWRSSVYMRRRALVVLRVGFDGAASHSSVDDRVMEDAEKRDKAQLIQQLYS